MPFPAVYVVHNHLSFEPIVTQLGKDNSPKNPVHATSEDDSNAYQAMQIVRQRFVHTVAIRRRHERRNSKVDVAKQEEDGNRQCGPDWWVPIPFLTVEV